MTHNDTIRREIRATARTALRCAAAVAVAYIIKELVLQWCA